MHFYLVLTLTSIFCLKYLGASCSGLLISCVLVRFKRFIRIVVALPDSERGLFLAEWDSTILRYLGSQSGLLDSEPWLSFSSTHF